MYPVKLGLIYFLLAAALLGGCDRERDGERERRLSQPMKSGKIIREASGSGILPPFNAGAATRSSDDAQGSPIAPPPLKTSGQSADAGTLPDGEYACYGSGSQVLAGLGFRTSGGRYTDLDGKNAGSVTLRGTDVLFSGGHHDGQIGRDFRGKSFRIASMAVCERW